MPYILSTTDMFNFFSNRPEDVRGPFEQFGRIKDVYLPKDYYTGYVRLCVSPPFQGI